MHYQSIVYNQNLIYMTVSFNIEYRTNWGEEVRITGSAPELGNTIAISSGKTEKQLVVNGTAFPVVFIL